MKKIIDSKLGIERAGGNVGLARELFLILQDELRKALVDLERPTTSDQEARKLAHKLRSSARYCAVSDLEQAAEKCELAVHKEKLLEYRNRLKAVIQEVLSLPNPY